MGDLQVFFTEKEYSNDSHGSQLWLWYTHADTEQASQKHTATMGQPWAPWCYLHFFEIHIAQDAQDPGAMAAINAPYFSITLDCMAGPLRKQFEFWWSLFRNFIDWIYWISHN